MPSSLAFVPVLASMRAALDQAVFPGKILVWLLFMLSIVGWVLIVSKTVQLWRSRRADRAFTEALRRSKTTLQVFEEGQEIDQSMKGLIYFHGAREAAHQMLGSRVPREAIRERLRAAAKLGARQFEFIRLAFQSGLRESSAQLSQGIELLLLISTTALLLGAFGFVWTLMTGFDAAAEFADLAPRAGGALGFLSIALLVAAPAVLGRLVLRQAVRRREEELERFRDDLLRLFERSFGVATEGSAFSGRAPREDPAPPPATSGGTPAADPKDDKKRYHSIRERLLRSDPGSSELISVNPIARQAATVGGALRGY